MFGIRPGDNKHAVWGLGLLYEGNVWGGGASSGALHWLEMTTTSRYSKTEQHFKWKSVEKDVLVPNLRRA